MGQLTITSLVRDLFEALFVVAAGGMVWAAIGRLRRREIPVVRCRSCGHTASNAYAACPHCGAPIA